MAVSEKRTQIYLPQAVFGSLKKESRREKKSIAQIIREAIDNHLSERAARHVDWKNDPLNKLVGLCKESGPSDLAANHDDYLYGDRRKKHP